MLVLGTFLAMVLGLIAAGFEGWAMIDAIIRPSHAFKVAGKATKAAWVTLTAVAFGIGLVFVLPGPGLPGLGGIASIGAIVVAIVYLADVRPAVRGQSSPPQPPAGW
ncbi:MAG: DUF2516 family protein [Bifidobacteriaceae bacterium]|jgi:hypothetical protein|nr:DUF2516 family protein [Bifidobacteriaceae bacterium]